MFVGKINLNKLYFVSVNFSLREFKYSVANLSVKDNISTAKISITKFEKDLFFNPSIHFKYSTTIYFLSAGYLGETNSHFNLGNKARNLADEV